ncbi:MAG: glycosyltransferase, partial [Anaerolineales bacterium]
MSAPLLSVVVASVNGRPYIDACLASLHNQEHVHSAQFNNPKSKINNPKSQIQNQQSQIIVVDRVGEGVTRFVQRDYPAVCLIATDSVFPNCKSLAELRAIGIKAARGQVIAITEDHCIAPPNWFAAILQAHNDHPPDATHPPDAIGGAVDNAATGRLLDRAVYLTEYVEFASPVPRGPVSQLPAANVSYKRPALEAMRTSLARGYHETALHQQMIEAGYLLWSDPSIV